METGIALIMELDIQRAGMGHVLAAIVGKFGVSKMWGGKIQTKDLLKLVGIFIVLVSFTLYLNSRFFDNTKYRFYSEIGEGKVRKDFLVNKIFFKMSSIFKRHVDEKKDALFKN